MMPATRAGNLKYPGTRPRTDHLSQCGGDSERMTENGSKQTKLGAIADLTNGGAWKQSEYSDEGVPVCACHGHQRRNC